MARKFFYACFALLAFSYAFSAQVLPQVPKSGITIEKYVANYDVNEDGTCTQTVETDRRLNMKSATDRLKRYELQFNAGLQQVEVLEATIVKPEGRKITVPANSIQMKPTAQAEAAPMFSSLKVLTVDFDNLEIGDTTHLKLRFKLIKPLIEGQFSAVETFPMISPWNTVEVNVSAPKDFPLEFEAIDLPGGRIADDSERAHWQWKAKIPNTVLYENGMINYTDFSPRLAISSFKNYNQLGAAYWQYAKEKTIVTPEIQKLANEITSDIKEPRAQAEAIYRWVNKNVRYLLVFLGRDGFIPRDARTTLENRFGDCKDYTNLTQTLLKAKGIESVPVLLRADSNYWLPKVPVSDYFNHAILYIPSLDVYADSTAPRTRLGLLPQVLVGKTVLLAGDQTGLVKIPDGKPEDNKFQTVTAINLQPDGSLKADVKNAYKGTMEMIYRSLFADSEAVKTEMFFRNAYAYYGYSGSGKIIKASNPFQSDEAFGVELEAKLDNYVSFAKPAGFKVPAAITLNNILDLEKLVALPRRKTPLLTGATVFDENFQISFPQGVVVDSVPEDTEFENSAGAYQTEYKIENNSVSFKRKLIITKDIFQPEDYQEIRELILKAVSEAKDEIRFSPTASFTARKAPIRIAPSQRVNSKVSAKLESIENGETPIVTLQSAIQLETALKHNPNDAALRKRLIQFYSTASSNDPVKSSFQFRAQKQKSVIEHYKWFVRNHPELNRGDIGLSSLDLANINIRNPQYYELKAEWLKQVEARKTDSVVRQNAIDFFYLREWQVAEKLLLEGEQIDAGNYKFPLKLVELYEDQSQNITNIEEKRKLSQKIFEQGEIALNFLKQERTEVRDRERGELLPKIGALAFEFGYYEKAKAYATELILEFSDDSNDLKYADVVHAGNIVLGKIALNENDLAKAKEYLLIAGRAPQRARYEAIVPDMELARMLLAKGEKTGVLEYLKLCEGLRNVNKRVLRRWQGEIEQNKLPNFNWNDYNRRTRAQLETDLPASPEKFKNLFEN